MPIPTGCEEFVQIPGTGMPKWGGGGGGVGHRGMRRQGSLIQEDGQVKQLNRWGSG